MEIQLSKSPPSQLTNAWTSCSGPIPCAESHAAIHFVIACVVVALEPRMSPNFEILNPKAVLIPTFDMQPLQSDGPCESCSGPTRCAWFPHAVHSTMRLLVVALQGRMYPNSGILNPAPGGISTFDIPPLQSESPWEHRTSPIRCAKSRGAIHSVIVPLVVALQAWTCRISGILNHPTDIFSTSDIPPLRSGSLWEYRPRPIWCAESRGPIHFVIGPLVVALQAETCPIFAFQNVTAGLFLTIDIVALQSTRHRGQSTGPTWCAESHGTVHFAVHPLVGALQAITCWNFGIAAGVFTTFDMLALQSTRHWG